MVKNLAQISICFLFVLLVSNIFGTGIAQPQSVPNTENSVSENNTIKILGIDLIAYPEIKINIFVDRFCAIAGNLHKEDFKVEEDGSEVAIDDFYFMGNASGQKLDLAVVFDDTNSMRPEIGAMKSNVRDLTDSIDAAGIDASYSLVSFGNDVSVRTEWTSDPTAFKGEVDALYVISGIDEPENPLDAIEAVLSMGFRSDAQKVILVITDNYAHHKDDGSGISSYTKDEVEADLEESGVILVVVSPEFEGSTEYVDMREVAEDTDSLWIDIESGDFLDVLEQFKGMLTGSYVIEYTSPARTTAGERILSVFVNAPECVDGVASSTYTAPTSATGPDDPPVITALTSDKTSPQETGAVITWTVEAADHDDYQVLYRFFLNDEPTTDWTPANTWTWTAPPEEGSYRIEAQVRDGKHAGPNGMDDRKSINFEIVGPNEPPRISALTTDKTSPQEVGAVITWTAEAEDPDGDQVLYRFFLEDEPMTDWTEERAWTWTAPDDAGSYRIEAYVRDGLHAGPKGMDDRRSTNFEIIETNGSSIGEISYEEFNRTFGRDADDRASYVQPTPDGGYILAGETASYGAGGSDAWLIKTDADGKEVWNKTFGGAKDETDWNVQPTSDGGYILLGATKSFGAGNADAWLIKTDSDGNKVWDKTFGGPADDFGKSVQPTSDGGYILAGYTASFGAGIFDVWLIKTDLGGREIWSKTFGGANLDATWTVQQMNDDGYILAGQTFNYGNGNILYSDAWLIKTDSRGDKLWDKTFGGTALDSIDSVQPTSDGGYILVGVTFSDGAGQSDAWLLKTDSQGREVWNRTFGGTDEEEGFDVRSTSDGGYIIAASTSAIWRNSSFQQNSDGNYIQSQPTESYLYGGEDVLLIKTYVFSLPGLISASVDYLVHFAPMSSGRS